MAGVHYIFYRGVHYMNEKALNVRLPEDELEGARVAAQERGVSLSRWVRDAMLAYRRVGRPETPGRGPIKVDDPKDAAKAVASIQRVATEQVAEKPLTMAEFRRRMQEGE